MLSHCSLRSHQPSLAHLARASLPPPRLLCSLRSPPRLCCSRLTRVACLLRSPVACCSLRLPCLVLASLAASPAARSARRLSCCPRSGRLACVLAPLATWPAALASLLSSPAARSARRLACRARFARRWPFRLLLASFAVSPAGSARPPHSPCPPRLLQHFSPGTSSRSPARRSFV